MKLAATVASAALLSAMAAAAGDNASFTELDQDQSGAIDQQESQAHEALAEKFEMADRDGNGELDRQEFTYAMARIQMEAGAEKRS
ncbi:MAG: calmodulin [Gammaproteobacteria bacterium]|nr:calmodulin [Gammaproteobacteria bacterium]|tara:strand:+ start:1127 stop:1384 length:258 start_codon:yes stop_codon:yes gene_type:complete